MAHRRLTREELHRLVWTRPMRDLATEFGVSDVGLKKICLRHDVEPPKQGHWQRVAAGDEIDPLPLTKREDAPLIDIYGADPVLQPKLSPEERARLEELLERETLPEYRIKLDAELVRLHPMTKRIHQALKASSPDKYGCLRCDEADLPSVRIMTSTIPRALALMDGFVRAAEARRFRWVAGARKGSWDRTASLEIEGVEHAIGLHETTRRQIHRLTPQEREDAKRGYRYGFSQYDFVGTNQLSFRPHNWDDYVRDTVTKKLEVRLNDLFVILINRAFREREERRQRELQAKQAAAFAARQAELARIRKIRADARETLFAAASDWRRAQELRVFLIAVEASLTADEKRAHSQWIDWARREIVALDPLTGADAKFLKVAPEALVLSEEQ